MSTASPIPKIVTTLTKEEPCPDDWGEQHFGQKFSLNAFLLTHSRGVTVSKIFRQILALKGIIVGELH